MPMSAGFNILFRDRPEVMKAWLHTDEVIAQQSALDAKTAELAYIAVISALGLERGMAFHATQAKQLGASRDEVISAVLVGLPAAGSRVIEAVEEAVRPFDEPTASTEKLADKPVDER
ncbi:MAG: carboxymuconolactone decarboxylase family protein [Chloroflexota bacterium]